MTDTTKSMNILAEMPTEGQFVMLHDFAGNMWSQTYKWEDDVLHLYLNESDTFEPEPDFETVNSALNILGYVVEV